jgi:RNA polymerase sigma-70 factor, ECF subfamily
MSPILPHTAAASALPDEALVARVLGGDSDAFGDLVARYQGPLYRHAAAMVLDHDVAADMVQDALVRAYVNLAACRDRTRFRAWLFQTLRNRCLDYLKEPRRQHVRLDDAGPIRDPAAGPAAGLEQGRLRDALRTALASLPYAQREAFVLHYVEGMPYDSMADLLDASVSALKMRVLRAREALGAALDGAHVTEAPGARLHCSSE